MKQFNLCALIGLTALASLCNAHDNPLPGNRNPTTAVYLYGMAYQNSNMKIAKETANFVRQNPDIVKVLSWDFLKEVREHRKNHSPLSAYSATFSRHDPSGRIEAFAKSIILSSKVANKADLNLIEELAEFYPIFAIIDNKTIEENGEELTNRFPSLRHPNIKLVTGFDASSKESFEELSKQGCTTLVFRNLPPDHYALKAAQGSMNLIDWTEIECEFCRYFHRQMSTFNHFE